jgi:hypothetical protein
MSRLIYQWIAHGFVTTNQAQQPEEVGIDYFNFLLKVCFLQDPIQHHYHSDVGYKMHDLVYDHYWKLEISCRWKTARKITYTDRRIRKSIYLSVYRQKNTDRTKVTEK